MSILMSFGLNTWIIVSPLKFSTLTTDPSKKSSVQLFFWLLCFTVLICVSYFFRCQQGIKKNIWNKKMFSIKSAILFLIMWSKTNIKKILWEKSAKKKDFSKLAISVTGGWDSRGWGSNSTKHWNHFCYIENIEP